MTKEERIEKMKLRFDELREIENEIKSSGYKYLAGVDEVGRGPLAGPVVSACVVLPDDFDVLGIDDSKKLSEKKRTELYDVIIEKSLAYGIGVIDNKIIDEINILQATKIAMKKAIEMADTYLRNHYEKEIDFVLFDAMEIKDVNKKQISLIKGDSKSLSIAAASIIAKVTRDRMMVEFDQVYPGYNFSSNKGYGTKDHYKGIENLGITPIHRKTFLKKIIY